MELDPQVVFERLFGSGATPEVRAARMRAEPQHSGFAARRIAGPEEESRRIRSKDRRSIHRRNSRDRAPAATGGEGIEPRFPKIGAVRHSRTVRRSHQAALGSAALAFQADITRVVTLLGARDLTGKTIRFRRTMLFPEGGVSVELPWRIASSGRSGPDQELFEIEPVSPVHDGVSRRTSSRRRGTATARCWINADSARHQHGQLESASALRCAALPRSAASTAS